MPYLLFALVFAAPIGILAGFAILPWRWSKVLLLFAGMSLVTTWSLFQEGRETRLPLMPIVFALQFGLMMGGIFFGAVIKMARVVWWGKADIPLGLQTPTIQWPNIIFGSALAFFLPILFGYHGAFARADGKHLFIGLGTTVIVLIVASVQSVRSKSYTFAATAASCALSLTVLSSYALSTGDNMQHAAKIFAQGKPYCIQSGNTAVTDIWDLTVLNLRAPRKSNMYLNYHALLVFRENGVNQFYNWSYHRSEFGPADMFYKPDLICTPQTTS